MSRTIKFRAFGGNLVGVVESYNNDFCEVRWGKDEVACDVATEDIIVVQFTGLLDKKGKAIYEEDILENENGQRFVVKWIEQISGFYLSIPNTHRGREIISCAASQVLGEPIVLYKMTITGNVFENPELLATEKLKTESQ